MRYRMTDTKKCNYCNDDKELCKFRKHTGDKSYYEGTCKKLVRNVLLQKERQK